MNVTVAGNLCADPTVRATPGGVTVAEFRLAENRRFKDRSGDWQTEASFHHVVCWRQLATHVASSVSKGDRVVVAGRLKQDSWTSDTGQNHTRYLIEADDIAISLRFVEARPTEPTERTQTEEAEYAPDDPRRPFQVTS